MIPFLLVALLSSTVDIDRAAGPQYGPVMIGGAPEGFVAWRDGRNLARGRWQVFGSRIDARGRLLDEGGIAISAPEADITSLDVVRVRGEVVVVWGEGFRTLWARRIGIDPAPVLLFAAPILWNVDVASNSETIAITGAGGAGLELFDANLRHLRSVDLEDFRDATFVASDGSDYLAGGAGRDLLVATRVSGNGDILGEPQTLLSGAPAFHTQAIWTGRDYFVLWSQGARLIGRYLGRNDILDVKEDWSANDVAGLTADDNGDVLVVFDDDNDIRGVRIGGDAFDVTMTPEWELSPAVAIVDGEMVVAWNGINTTAGTPDEETTSAPAQRHVNAAGRIVVWEEVRGHRSRIMASIDGRTPFAVSPSQNFQHSPAVAAAGDAYLVVWYEQYEWVDVKAIRLDHTGEPLDAAPMQIGRVPYHADAFDTRNGDAPPAVLWNGRNFLVAIAQDYELSLLRVTAGGRSRSVQVPERERRYPSRPVLTGSGDDTFLIWQEGRNDVPCITFCSEDPAIIRAVRLDADGEPIGVPFDVASTDHSSRPHAAWNGHLLAVTWLHDEQVFAQRFTRHGFSFEAPQRVGAASPHAYPVIANDDGTFVLAWQGPSPKYSSQLMTATLGGNAIGVDTLARRPAFWRDAQNRLFLVWESLATAAAPGVPRIVAAVRSEP